MRGDIMRDNMVGLGLIFGAGLEVLFSVITNSSLGIAIGIGAGIGLIIGSMIQGKNNY